MEMVVALEDFQTTTFPVPRFHVRKKEKFPLPRNDIIFQQIFTVSLRGHVS
jgi:hypothetical protein